uniref:Uncharacterized protein n=1 Tax=Ciona intestinalis TaxID=7719 RepID=H2Y202_CIOIN
MNFQSILLPSSSIRTSSLPNTFRTSFSIWHISKSTYTFWVESSGCLKKGCKLIGFKHAPSLVSIEI